MDGSYFNIFKYTLPIFPNYIIRIITGAILQEVDSEPHFKSNVITIIQTINQQLVGDNKPFRYYIPQKDFKKIVGKLLDTYPLIKTRYQRLFQNDNIIVRLFNIIQIFYLFFKITNIELHGK